MPSSSALAAPQAAATPGFMQADSISALNTLQQLSATAAVVPSGFQESVVFSGLTNPTAVRFASDGRVFVAEKRGIVKEFDSLTSTVPTVVADLRSSVDDYWDRGLLGLALDPNFPTTPYIYLAYTFDAPIGGTAPVWNDGCPSPPGPTTDGCVVSGRLVRIQVAGNTMVGSQQVLLNDWCAQYPSHTIGDLVFGPDGALYMSGGTERASPSRISARVEAQPAAQR